MLEPKRGQQAHWASGKHDTPEQYLRRHVIGNNGQTLQRHDFQSENDAAALEHARQYLSDKDVEVRQLDRVVGTLKEAGT